MAVWAKKETPLAMVRTYGCQQNVSDGEKIKGMLQQMGFGFTEDQEEADFILFNTCAIREHAEDRIFGNVGALKYLKRRNPSLIIALCGCMMEQEHVVERIRKSYPFVSLVFGTHSLSSFPQLVYETLTGAKRVFQRGGEDTIDENIPVRRDGRFKAWLPVMYGCDNFCSYCVVPYVRGRERSREPEAVLKEARQLIEGGYKDITLLGQNVNSYGKNLPEPVNFAKLLKDISDMEGDYWLRFMTSHPKDCTKELIDVMASSGHIAKHLHLPFQSGNNRVLKEMNRRYTREQYLEIIRYAREKMPGLSITSDVIVGFPGETYEEFQDTLSLIREVGFTALYTFIFSPRKGTPAAGMPESLSSRLMNKVFCGGTPFLIFPKKGNAGGRNAGPGVPQGKDPVVRGAVKGSGGDFRQALRLDGGENRPGPRGGGSLQAWCAERPNRGKRYGGNPRRSGNDRQLSEYFGHWRGKLGFKGKLYIISAANLYRK